MAKPAYDEATLSAFFMEVDDRLYDDPIVGPVLKRLATDDPDILQAVADVDRSLIRASLARTVSEQLTECFGRATTLLAMRRVPR